ncbi:reverse transcriptase domain-containing protein [Tanacetum coccineum]
MVFGNMKRVGKGFSGAVTPLFTTMMVQAQEEMGEGSAMPTDPHHTPIIQPSTSQPQKKQSRRKQRKGTEIPQSSVLTEPVADKAVHKERGDSVERSATTTSSLEAEQDSGNIIRTQSTAIPNVPLSQRIGSGCRPRRQETMGDSPAQTRFESLSKQSNDPPLSRVNTLGSREDKLKLKELIDLYTKLSDRVLDLKITKTAQAKEIASLKKRVKNMERKRKSKTLGMKRLFKIGRSARVISSEKKWWGGLGLRTIITTEEITLAQTLVALKSVKPNVDKVVSQKLEQGITKPTAPPTTATTTTTTKGILLHEPSETRTTTRTTTKTTTPVTSSKDKGRGIIVEEPLKMKKKDQDNVETNYELAQSLQAEEQEGKKQKVDDDKEREDLQQCFELVTEEDVAIDAIPLATNPIVIVDYKIHRKGKQGYYKIIRADGSSKIYLLFSQLIKSFDREDLETLWKLVKAKHGNTRPEEGYERVLWGDLKTMFEHHTEATEAVFLEMKKLVSELPTLTNPKKGETLMMYLAAENEAISAVLLTKRDGRQMPIHYVSRYLQGAETNYALMEKLTLALVHAARRLRRYFQAHPIKVITDSPIEQVLNNSGASGRLAKWAVELGAYGITYVPRVAVKGHVFAYFLADTPTKINATPERLYTDGASNNEGSGAGLILISLDDVEYSYALRLNFSNSNNDAEYEALLARLRIAKEMQVKDIHVFVDSKLVSSQVEGSYEAKGERMIKYREKVLELAGAFNRDTRELIRACNVCQAHASVPRLPKANMISVTSTWPFMKWGFGIPATIIIDNETQLGNGAVERANKSLLRGIKTRLEKGGSAWDEEVPNVLWAHRSMKKTSNGEIPFSLTYGTEAVIPAEIGMPTHKTSNVNEKTNDQELRLNLDLLDERREIAAIREARYKQQVQKYYNKKVRHVQFKVGEFVLRRNEVSRAANTGKLGPT